MEVYDTFFFLHTGSSYSSSAFRSYSDNGHVGLQRFVVLVWIAQFMVTSLPALDSSQAIYSLSKLGPGPIAFPWTALASPLSSLVQNNCFKLEPKASCRYWAFFLFILCTNWTCSCVTGREFLRQFLTGMIIVIIIIVNIPS
ncbi:hypothetical protein BDW75DRAFT_181976 [Aspergillus navahoensis]